MRKKKNTHSQGSSSTMLDRGVQKEFKICPICNRPFTRRKKRAKNWDEVKYCSERCKRR